MSKTYITIQSGPGNNVWRQLDAWRGFTPKEVRKICEDEQGCTLTKLKKFDTVTEQTFEFDGAPPEADDFTLLTIEIDLP